MKRTDALNSKLKTKNSKLLSAPWTPEELKDFWAMAKLAKLDRARVRVIIEADFGKAHLADLTRDEWLGLMHAFREYCRPLRRQAMEKKDPAHGRANDGQWARIRWLQGRLGWTDAHRDNYIRQHGHIDTIAWMTVPIARAVIAGMEKTLAWQEKKRERGE